MIVPNDEIYGKELFTYPNKDGQIFNYSQLLKERGYQLIFEQPKYMNPLIQRYGVSPKYHYLFELIM